MTIYFLVCGLYVLTVNRLMQCQSNETTSIVINASSIQTTASLQSDASLQTDTSLQTAASLQMAVTSLSDIKFSSIVTSTTQLQISNLTVIPPSDMCLNCSIEFEVLKRNMEEVHSNTEATFMVKAFLCEKQPTDNRNRICQRLIQHFFPTIINDTLNYMSRHNICSNANFCQNNLQSQNKIIVLSHDKILKAEHKISETTPNNCEDCTALLEAYNNPSGDTFDLANVLVNAYCLEPNIVCEKLLRIIHRQIIKIFFEERSRDSRAVCAEIKECDSNATINRINVFCTSVITLHCFKLILDFQNT